jgi:hypothetical protein
MVEVNQEVAADRAASRAAKQPPPEDGEATEVLSFPHRSPRSGPRRARGRRETPGDPGNGTARARLAGGCEGLGVARRGRASPSALWWGDGGLALVAAL